MSQPPVDEHQHDDEDCGDALQELYVFLDGELTAERRAMIRSHLDHCTDCLEAYDFEAELRAVISACCRERVPEHLRARIAAALVELRPTAEH